MIGGNFFLSVLPKGLFSFAAEGGACGSNPLAMVLDDTGKKRCRDFGGRNTPTISQDICGGVSCDDVQIDEFDDCSDRPRKRRRGQSKTYTFLPVVPLSPKVQECKKQTSDLINKLPQDVVANCLSFLGSAEDRFALQTTCKLFRHLSNADSMLENVDVAGDPETGNGCIIQEHDTPASAAEALSPFARAGNLEAMYMLGIVKTYCYQDLKNGILMLKMASSQGYNRSSYTLGIILRDALPDEASKYMNLAAASGYLPALQEILPAREMKERFGEPNAEELRSHLDPIGLNRLLLRDYVNSPELRGLNTSHCWNPLCGKWAYKASNTNSFLRMRRFNGPVPTYDVDENMLDPPSIDPGTASPLRERDGLFMDHDNNGNIRHNSSLALQRLHQRMHHSSYANSMKKRCSSPKKNVQALAWTSGGGVEVDRVARMKMCSRCCRAKYCSKLCQVYDWRSSQHKMECQFL
ncbi:MYND finger domain containing protein [Nitzschia inconspicua]|uniref:MYND finger domain containing protein n=1 Tax=Nitzschia inconspicua TaxID=303405 RepID=A0A9K3L0W9_9STRA|nr:MYND finger domain containing protein [Nitzschia inconspicua]